MGMTRGTALVPSIARVVQLTGLQDLANLESDGELAVTDLLVTASDAIYDQLEGDGFDPMAITNQNVFERSVAWHFLALLAKLGYVPVVDGLEPPDDPYAWSDPFYTRVRAKLPDSESRRPDEVLPLVGNFTRRGFFDTHGRYFDDRPRRR